MALEKSDLNVTLKSAKRREEQFNLKDKTTQVVEEKFAKTTTLLGNKDGEILGGVKSLGKLQQNPSDVLTNSVGKLTDKASGLKGTKTPSTELSDITGLPAQKDGDKKNTGIEAINAGNLEGVAESVAVGADKTTKTAKDIKDFAKDIGDAGENSLIDANLPDVKVGELDATAKELSTVPEISGKDALGDVVSDETGLDGLTPDGVKPKSSLEKFNSATEIGRTDFGSFTNALNDFGNEVTKVSNEINQVFDKGLGGFLQDITETLTGAATATITNIVSGGISLSQDENKKVLGQAESKDPAKIADATATLVSKSPNVTDEMKGVVGEVQAEGVSSTNELNDKVIRRAREQGISESDITSTTNEVSTVEGKLLNLDTTIGGSVVVNQALFDNGESVNATNQKWAGANSGDEVFTHVASVEELDFEMQTITRDITEVVIHATETFHNKNIGAVEINSIQKELGHDGIGYHYVIRRDGRLQRGRPVNRKGEHAPVNGHDTYSIGVVMVGGLAAASGDEAPLQNRSAHAFTRDQFQTLEKFLASYYRKFPGGQVFGHNDIDVDELDPYFDVPDYIDAVFGKQNTTVDSLNKSSISPTEINNDN